MAGSKVPSTPATVTQAQEVERSCAVLRELWELVRIARGQVHAYGPAASTLSFTRWGSYYITQA